MNTPLVRFSGAAIHPEGVIKLLVKMGTHPQAVAAHIDFLVVKLQSIYNIILGRITLNVFEVIVSTPHLAVKFPTPRGIGTEKGDQLAARQCHITTIRKMIEQISHPVEEEVHIPADSRSIIDTKPNNAQPAKEEEVEDIQVAPGRSIKVGRALQGIEHEDLIKFLQENVKVFAWTAEEMTGIDMKISEHRLLTRTNKKLVRQKKRRMGVDRNRAVRQEVDKLLEVGFIREVACPEWVANPVLVKKSNGEWRTTFDTC